MRLLVWWLLLAALGSTTAPFLARLFPELPDRGATFARPIAIAILGLGAWLLGSCGVPYGAALVVTLGMLAIAAALEIRRSGLPTIPGRELLRSEITFAAALLFFVGIRALRPEIFGAEKYMDFAFFNSILRTSEIPPEDPWLAGTPINYYYFGYLLFANLARLSSIAPEVAYNLSLATIGAVLFAGAAAIGRALSGSARLGLLGGFAVAIFGNLDGARQMWIERRGLGALDYWRSSRVVPDTINEFPFFSLLHGDLHPHVSALLLEIPLVALLLCGSSGSAASALAIALLAAVGLANPWDLPLAFALLGMVSLRRTWRREAAIRSLLPTAILVVAAVTGVVVLGLPFLRHFAAPLGGVGWVHAHTTAADAFIVFGILALPAFLAIGARAVDAIPTSAETRGLAFAALAFGAAVFTVAGRTLVLPACVLLLVAAVAMSLSDRRPAAGATTLVALAAAAVALCEIVFLRDAYGTDLHRMNTVFKFYFQAWIYGALAWPAMVALAIERLDSPLRRRVATGTLAILVAAGLAYPTAAIVTFGRTAPRPLGIDGLAYLDREHPDDSGAIRWLRDHTSGRPRVLEATGDAYSYFARVSSNTGLPTLLGWANHEGVWRGNDPRAGERASLVRRIYEEPSGEAARGLLARHGVRWVFVGELERKTHPGPGLEKFGTNAGSFRLAHRSGRTEVYEVTAESR